MYISLCICFHFTYPSFRTDQLLLVNSKTSKEGSPNHKTGIKASCENKEINDVPSGTERKKHIICTNISSPAVIPISLLNFCNANKKTHLWKNNT